MRKKEEVKLKEARRERVSELATKKENERHGE